MDASLIFVFSLCQVHTIHIPPQTSSIYTFMSFTPTHEYVDIQVNRYSLYAMFLHPTPMRTDQQKEVNSQNQICMLHCST